MDLENLELQSLVITLRRTKSALKKINKEIDLIENPKEKKKRIRKQPEGEVVPKLTRQVIFENLQKANVQLQKKVLVI